MNNADWERVFQLIESNSRAIAALGEKQETDRRFYIQRIESNSKAIAALANKVEDDRRIFIQQIEANTKAIGDLTEILRQLQSGQGALMKVMAEKQEVLQDFRDIIKAILDRMERQQSQTNQYIETNQQEMVNLRESFLTMQQEILGLLGDLAKK